MKTIKIVYGSCYSSFYFAVTFFKQTDHKKPKQCLLRTAPSTFMPI